MLLPRFCIKTFLMIMLPKYKRYADYAAMIDHDDTRKMIRSQSPNLVPRMRTALIELTHKSGTQRTLPSPIGPLISGPHKGSIECPRPRPFSTIIDRERIGGGQFVNYPSFLHLYRVGGIVAEIPIGINISTNGASRLRPRNVALEYAAIAANINDTCASH